MVNIASRASWKAARTNGDINLSGLAAEVFLHHTVTKHLPANASVEDEREQMRAVEAVGYARFKNYGQAMPYNILIFPSGRPYEGVSMNRRGCHTDRRNSTARSIAFVGNYENTPPTAAQLETAAQVLAEGRGKWWKKDAPLRGHRDIKATACPGRLVYAKRGSIVARANAISGGAVTPVSKPSAPAKPAVKPVAKPAAKPAPKPAAKRTLIAEDGSWGPATTRALQAELGTPVDGVISSQPSTGIRVYGLQTARRPKGSLVIKALQKRVGAKQDGFLGPETVRALQRYLGTPVDGKISSPVSLMVIAMQKRLNKGTF